MSEKRVTLVGCGSIGSKIASNLAASGLIRFNLIDCDYFEPNNTVRHEVGLDFFGCNKEYALNHRLCSLNPAVSGNSKCMPFQVGAIWPYSVECEFRKLVGESDLLIDATGVHGVSHALNEMAFELRIPIVFASVTNGAWGGEIVRAIPGKTACWLCWLDEFYNDKPPSGPSESTEVFAPGCDQPTFTGTTHEIGMVANLATSMAVDTLLGPKEFSKNFIRWSGRNPQGQELFLAEVLVTKAKKGCPLCGG